MKQLPPIVKRPEPKWSWTFQVSLPWNSSNTQSKKSTRLLLTKQQPVIIKGNAPTDWRDYGHRTICQKCWTIALKMWEHTLSPLGEIVIVKTIPLTQRNLYLQPTDNTIVIFSASFQTNLFTRARLHTKDFVPPVSPQSHSPLWKSTYNGNIQHMDIKTARLPSICLLHVQSH